MLQNLKSQLLLVLCVIFTVLHLLLFMAFKAQAYNLMELEIRWLVVAGITALFTFIFAGYIKAFKGFGIELAANLSDTLPGTLIILL